MDTFNKKIILYAVSALALTASTGFLIQTESYVGLKKEFNILFKSNEKNKAQLNKTTPYMGLPFRIILMWC